MNFTWTFSDVASKLLGARTSMTVIYDTSSIARKFAIKTLPRWQCPFLKLLKTSKNSLILLPNIYPQIMFIVAIIKHQICCDSIAKTI